MAQGVADGAKGVAGTNVVSKKVGDVTAEDLLSADAVIVGSPVYFGNMSGEVKTFFDNWLLKYGVFREFKMRNKVGAAFTTGGAISNGKELTMLAIHHLNERTLKAAKGTLGAGSLAVRADVSKLADLDTMFATIKREFGHLDGLFVNAGYSEFLPFEEVTEQSFDMVIGSNFKGAYFTIQKALPLLRPGSSVVINASVGARKGWPTTSTVSTCKAAVVHLARILSAELIGRGIRVNTLSPGPTDTAMFGRFAGEEQGDAVKGVLATNNPSKRMADPSEIAKLAVYLATDNSAYVVGADFLIDGGVTAISGVGA